MILPRSLSQHILVLVWGDSREASVAIYRAMIERVLEKKGIGRSWGIVMLFAIAALITGDLPPENRSGKSGNYSW